ncbi:uncharacterized mitochondrial protein AtMg00810-like [Manihot esculenta]|uniref:uncharacterized mitochondrial protein AtMg00810-like n=1 Tax=Manihot esculenta TaxID=3983 RepID=UPI000B5D088B|nr:uncharacterized mitochondrial protein AtMg00810-like [Manihot esculenta]
MDLLSKAQMFDCKGISTLASSNDKITAMQSTIFFDSTLYKSIVGGLHILRYLKATTSYGLLFSKSLDTNLNVYMDVDWASDLDDRKSTTGFAIFMDKNLIYWNSKKQQTVAKSSTEAEYRAIGFAIIELTWI